MAGEKRSQEQEETLLSQTTILVDIEGTTTSISFVKETLFPYVRENLKKYIDTKWENEEFKQDFNKLKEQAKKDEEDKVDGVVLITGATVEEEKESLLKNILWQMDNDRKTGALKQLQGHMWREAYKSGAVKGHVYEDVPKALESWTNDAKKVYVYSSGSVEAQKLLFGNTEKGDLTKYFSGFFDTEVGAKRECDSYKNILNKIGEKPNNVIFLTDVVQEAAAAKEAGLLSAIVMREGNATLTDEETVDYMTIKSLLDLTFQTSSKRPKLNPTEPEEKKELSNSSEPMDTSEDVEMADISGKKTEKAELNEGGQSEQESKLQTEKKDQCSSKKDEVVKDIKDVETVTSAKTDKKDDAMSSIAKQPDTSTKSDASENASIKTSSSSEEPKISTEKKTEQSAVVSETKTENVIEVTKEKMEATTASATTVADEAMDVAKTESVSKVTETSLSTEHKKDETTSVTKETKSESTPQNETVKVAKDDQSKVERASDKSEECKTSEKTETKIDGSTGKVVVNSSTIEKKNTETNETVKNTTQTSTNVESASLPDATKNSSNVTAAEKIEKPVVGTEAEVTDTKKDLKDQENNTATEKRTEVETNLEKIEEDSKKTELEKENVEATSSVTKTEKHTDSVESIEKESSKESVKEETVLDEVKDKSTVDSEKKKINGTTQNGDDVPVSDENLHRNGLNEASSSEQLVLTSSEDTPAQNGEPESSSDTNAESIKVKKVVDSAIADGAGEPDVVPPVVVAATS